MDGFTDSPMRALQGEIGSFTFAVSEFIRVSNNTLPPKVFQRDVPELLNEGQTSTGLPVQIQILGGNPRLMAESAQSALKAGAQSIDINFGCPAPTVNNHDGGATLLQKPQRVREVVAAVREALPAEVSVSAKLRLGWDDIQQVHENAAMAEAGGASWIVIHARTKMQRYRPPVHWGLLNEVRKARKVPIVANGDIWTLQDFQRCREQTGCRHFMLGRGALVNPLLATQVAQDLGLRVKPSPKSFLWSNLLRGLARHSQNQTDKLRKNTLHRLKQWLNLARKFGSFEHFDELKRLQTQEEFFDRMALLEL